MAFLPKYTKDRKIYKNYYHSFPFFFNFPTTMSLVFVLHPKSMI